MRRLLQLFAGTVLLSGMVGCNCWTGVCDCEPHGCPNVANCPSCGGSNPMVAGQSAAAPAAQATMPRELPKTVSQ